MRRLTLRLNIHLATLTSMLIGAAAAVAQEPSAHTAVISYSLPAGASRPAAQIDVGALTEHSDFTAFMREDMPEGARLAALRRLWVLMAPPASCQELCVDVEPSSPGLPGLTSETLPIATQ